jgi:hypothetical protein
MTLETEDRLKKEHTAQAAQQYVTLPGINSLPTAERLSTNNSPSESLAAETTPTIAVAAAPDSKPFGAQLDKRSIAVLSAGHIFNDLNQGALPVMLPYLITAHHLTYEQAAGLVLMTNLFSSLLQPGFGTYQTNLHSKSTWLRSVCPWRGWVWQRWERCPVITCSF